MENLNFDSINLSIARPGTRAAGSSTPEVYTAPTVNKLVMNAVASKKLQLQHGDTVTILVNEDAADVNQMYFLTKGIKGMEAQLASTAKEKAVGQTLSFSYAGIWSRMVQNTTDAVEVSTDSLEREGLVVSRETEAGKTSYSATRKVFFEIGEAIEHDDMVIYPLVNNRVDKYDPRSLGATEVEDED